MKKLNLNTTVCCLLMLFFCLLGSCKKQNEWLDKKNNKSSVVPETLEDFQAIFDYPTIMNYQIYLTTGLLGTDNFYLNDLDFAARVETDRNLYTWNNKIWSSNTSVDWNSQFKVIEMANLVLDGLEKINNNSTAFNNVRGQALFHRAWAYYNLAQLFCKPYNRNSINSDLGLPLRLNSDINIPYQRSSLESIYDQILSDAQEAASLLPDDQPYKQRPINATAYALLSKVYLNMEDYVKAGNYADKVLALSPALLNYNSSVVSTNLTYRFPTLGQNNPEILFFAYGVSLTMAPSVLSPAFVDNDLYQSYSDLDLRKSIFYAVVPTGVKFRGTYTGDQFNFAGIATNEIYLIRAECYARNGDFKAGMDLLNQLLVNRYKTNQFTPLSATNVNEALIIILNERRKELPNVSNIRWEDLRRLNKDSRFQKTLTRVIKGITFTLPPNDKRYVLPIPEQEIQASGIQQNER